MDSVKLIIALQILIISCGGDSGVYYDDLKTGDSGFSESVPTVFPDRVNDTCHSGGGSPLVLLTPGGGIIIPPTCWSGGWSPAGPSDLPEWGGTGSSKEVIVEKPVKPPMGDPPPEM